MKYAEININQKLFGKENIVYDWVETEKENRIYMKSKSQTGKCPVCGELSGSYHGTYERKIQSSPIGMKTTYLYIKAYKYKGVLDGCDPVILYQYIRHKCGGFLRRPIYSRRAGR